MAQHEQEHLLNEILPNVAAQLRGSLGNVHAALQRMQPADPADAAAERNMAILMQNYYRAMRLVNKHYAEKQGLVAELAVFDPADKDTPRKLRKFFSRFGYEAVPCDYKLGGTQVELMVKPLKSSEDVSPVIHRLIRDFYSRVLSPARMEKTVEIRRV